MIKSNKISLQSTASFLSPSLVFPITRKQRKRKREREKVGGYRVAWRRSSSLVAYASCVLASASWTGPFEPAGWRKPRDGTRRARKRSAPRAVTLVARARVHVSWAYLHTVVAQCGRYVYEMHVRCRPRPVSFFLNSVNVYTPGGRRCL